MEDRVTTRMAGFLVGVVLTSACPALPTRGAEPVPDMATSLTVAEARKLSQPSGDLSLPRLASLTPDVAAALLDQPIDALDLPALTAIEPDVAAALVRRGRLCELRLDGVKCLAPRAARVLAGHEGRLRLGGLEAIAPDTAAEFAAAGGRLTSLALPLPPGTPVESLRLLARVGHNLEFVGPVTFTADCAEAFAGFSKYITLSGSVAPLDPEVARTLTFPGTFHVPGAIELSDEVAGILATRAGDTWITGLTAISPGVARMLAGRRESVSLLRLTEIDPASAAVLATYAGPALHFDALESLSPDAARALTAFRGRLAVMSPGGLPADVVAILAAHASWLDLGIETLTPEEAAALAPHEQDLSLPGIEALDGPDATDVARALASKRGPLALRSLKRITVGALSALAEKSDIDVPPLAELEIVPDVPGGVVDDVVLPRGFLERQRERRR